eukprot:Em0001g3207a
MQYKYSESQFNTLASEVKCLRVIEKKRSKQRAEYLQKQDDILSQQTRLKPERATKADPEKKKASVRDSYKADPEKKKASVRDSYKADSEKKKASVRDSYNADIESKQSAKGSDIKRTSRRTALLKGRNTRTIQLPLRHLKGIGIGMTPAVRLAKRAAERKRFAGVTELPLPPKDTFCPPYCRSRQQQLPALAPAEQSCPHCCPTAKAETAPTSSSRSRATAATCTSPHHGTSIGTSAPTTTLPAATLAAATTTRMAPMAKTRPPRP